MTFGRRVWVVVAVLLGLLLAGVLMVRGMFHFPPETRDEPVRCAADAPLAPADRPLTVLVWNVQFAAGRGQEFFYDGGEAVSVSEATVRATLEQIAAVVEAVDPDVLLLQEIDRDSRRTARLDQHAWLAERLDVACHVSAPYHRAAYVPHPPQEHLGRVDMHLSVMSRYRLGEATRHQLPLLQESWLRRLFNLKRAVLEVHLPVAGGGELVLFDTHLSAFSRNDGTLERQIAALDELMGRAEASGQPWLLAGDLNTLPPGDRPDRLTRDQDLYATQSSAAPLVERWASPVTDWTDPAYRTYLHYGADEPDRMLDYVFHGEGVAIDDYRVLLEHDQISDHLPLAFEVRILE